MALRRISTVMLRREISRRERGASRLMRTRDKLAKTLARLEAELGELGVSDGARRGRGRKLSARKSSATRTTTGRPKATNKLTLADALAAAVRSGTVVSPADAAKRVRTSGYRSKSKTFGIQVATTLAKDKRFKRRGRGQYERVA